MSIPEEETTIEPEEPREKESVRMMILRVIHNAWMAWGFTFFFCLVTSERTPQNIALTFLLPAYALLCDYLQKKSRNFFFFFGLLAGGWIGIGFAIPDTFLRIDALIIAFMAMFFTFWARFSEQYIFYPRGGFLASGIIMFILGALTERPAASRFAFVYEVVLSVLILLCRSEESLEDAVAQVPKGGIIPMDTIRAQYRRNLAKWLIGGAGCLVLLWIFRSGDFIANAIEQSVRFLLLWIIRFINWIISLSRCRTWSRCSSLTPGPSSPGLPGRPIRFFRFSSRFSNTQPLSFSQLLLRSSSTGFSWPSTGISGARASGALIPSSTTNRNRKKKRPPPEPVTR